MRRMIVILSLAIVAVLVPWQLGYDPSLLAAATDTSIGWTGVKPTSPVAGQKATVETRVQAKVATTVTVEAVARDAKGQVAWQTSWPGQVFKAWQGRTYTGAWDVPSAQAGGKYTLTVRVLDAAGREAAPSKAVTFALKGASSGAAPPAATATKAPAATATPVATATKAPAASPTATQPPSDARLGTPTPPTATPAPATSGYPFKITGSATFVAGIKAGLELMRTASPQDYAIITGYVTEIKEGPNNWAWGGSRVIQISTSSASFSRTYSGSIVLHEAVHVKNWFTNNFPVFGCDGEAKSLRAQASYLRKVGDSSMASWVESLIGTWC